MTTGIASMTEDIKILITVFLNTPATDFQLFICLIG